MYNGVFNNTDDIVIFNNYDTNEINTICSTLNNKVTTIRELYNILNSFTQETFGLEIVYHVIFPHDTNITTKMLHIYLHRIVRLVIEKCNWSKIYDRDKLKYYNMVVSMPQLLIKYIR